MPIIIIDKSKYKKDDKYRREIVVTIADIVKERFKNKARIKNVDVNNNSLDILFDNGKIETFYMKEFGLVVR